MNLLLFMVILGVLIVVHEWGHFIVAKRSGIGVERFSIGFGPVLLKRMSGGTEFCVSLIPLGGYVKLEGDDPKACKGAATEFNSKPIWVRTLVVLAGPFMNALLAIFIFSTVYFTGMPAWEPVVGKVLEDSPAEAAGLQEGDWILEMDGRPVKVWDDLWSHLEHNKGAEILLDIERGSEVLHLEIRPRLQTVTDPFGKEQHSARMGIAPSGQVTFLRTPFMASIGKGISETLRVSGLILKALYYVVTGQISFRGTMAGPIGIYFLVDQAAQAGFASLCLLTAYISVSLFVFNLLPLPVLDGGHLLFFAIDKLRGRPLSERVKEKALQVGLCFFLALAVFVIYQDMVTYGIWDRLKDWAGAFTR